MSLWFNTNQNGADDWAIFTRQSPNDPLSTGDCTYTSGVLTYNTYCEYGQAVRSCYFDVPDPSNPGLITDDAFKGIPRASACGATVPGLARGRTGRG